MHAEEPEYIQCDGGGDDASGNSDDSGGIGGGGGGGAGKGDDVGVSGVSGGDDNEDCQCEMGG